MITHYDLFAGIGGFSYAADQVFGEVEHVFVEWDGFCQQVLKKHWPEAKIYGDIRDVTDTTIQRLERRSRKEQAKSGSTGRTQCDLLTGGFPCQPFSAAGLRRGTSDERHLWPEMLRVIQLTQPTWVIAENVRGLVTWSDGLVLEQVCADLEASNYEVQPLIIPAVAVNAPHRRDRIWFVANRAGEGQHERQQQGLGQDEKENKTRLDNRPQRYNRNAADTPSDRRIRGGTQTEAQKGHTTQSEPGGQLSSRLERQDSDAADTESNRRKRRVGQPLHERREGGSAKHSQNVYGLTQQTDWNADWHEVAAEFCSVDDGLPVALDGLKLSKSQHRKEQLKAYGNAIVPAVAVEIMRAIREAMTYGQTDNRTSGDSLL